MILPNNRKHVHTWRRGRPEDFDDFALGIHMPRLPVVEANYNFVANCSGGLRRPTVLYRPSRAHVNIVHETWIIGHHVVKTSRPLQRTDDGIVSTFEDSNHAPFASSFYPPGRQFRRYSRNDTVSMHRGADVFRRNENIQQPRLFRGEKRIASRMDK